MSKNKINFDDKLYQYLLSISKPEPELLQKLREKTATLDAPRMEITPDQGQFMQLLIKLLGVKNILEIGTFTGYSALWCALALPEEGKITCCDINKEWTDIAKDFWQQAGVAQKIELKLQPALDSLNEMETESFDLIFIDADKANYPNYYEKSLTLLKPGGLIIIDNIFFGGSVTDPSITRDAVVKIRETSQTMKNDDRIDLSIIPVGDGIALARKKL